MEHIQSHDLTDRLDKFLDFPKFDPHGDPIPDKDGNIKDHPSAIGLFDLGKGNKGVIVGVNDSSDDFLRYLERHNLGLGTQIELVDRFEFDQSVSIHTSSSKNLSLSAQAARNIIVREE